MTPEGKVKRAVSKVLNEFGVHYDMPVPGGFGASSLDYVGCYYGLYFTIETKAPGKKPTPRQMQIASRVERAGGKVFVIDDTDPDADGGSLAVLVAWLKLVAQVNEGLDG